MKKTNITGMILAAISLIMLAGACTWFRTCAPMEDGSFMACHWAGQMIKATSALALLLSVIRIIMKDTGVKTGIDISIAALAVLIALIPGRLINLCMMDDMMCRAHTQPWTIGLAVILLIAAVADIFLLRSGAEADRHHRR